MDQLNISEAELRGASRDIGDTGADITRGPEVNRSWVAPQLKRSKTKTMTRYANLPAHRPAPTCRRLIFIVSALSILLTGCDSTARPPAATTPIADAYNMKDRSLEIQRQIADLFPKEYTTKNELKGPDEDFKMTLLKCKPILSDEYWKSEDNNEGVQYTGYFVVRLDEGAPVAEIVDQIYQDIIHSPDIELVEDLIPDNPTEDVTLYTTDGYEIMLSYVLPEKRNRYDVGVDVWSPCFIPETMPPSHEI